jgi:protein-S-isoprenylcysteine O-methyltransferase Ste14
MLGQSARARPASARSITSDLATWSAECALNQSYTKRPESQPQNGLALRLPPVALVVIVAVLMWVASATTPTFGVFVPAKRLSAVSLTLIGAATCLSGVVSFRRAKTTVNPMKPDSTSSLFISGIYKYTRNPMYLGFLLVLVGWAAFLSNLAALALLPAFVVYMNRFQIRPEERVLDALFPNEYAAYRAKVRLWI